jgi:EpsI family protein
LNNTFTRLLVAAALVALGYFGIGAVRAYISLPMVRPPAADIRKLPMRLGKYQGEIKELDKELFDRVGAEAVVERAYRDDADNIVSLHLAIFKDPDTGVSHAPDNCYRAKGWRRVKQERIEVPDSGQPPLLVDLSTWEGKSGSVMVLFWYRFGDRTLFGKWGMFKARWAMSGQSSWPSMIKVLLQTPVTDVPMSRGRILDMARLINDWVKHWDVATPAQGVKVIP